LGQGKLGMVPVEILDIMTPEYLYDESSFEPQRHNPMDIVSMKRLYMAAKSAKKGETFKCPYCGRKTLKTTYHKKFCSNRKTAGQENCKDFYWNAIRDINPLEF
jgi:hypothetical protein